MRRSMLASFLLVAPALASAPSAGCAPPSGAGRPVPLLSEADREADPSCTASWLAALTARVVDDDGRPVAGARVAPCLRLGDGTATCLAPATTDAQGWAVAMLEPGLRCVERLVVRVVTATPAHATSYQSLALAPTRGVLDVEGDLVVVATHAPVVSAPASDPATMHEVRFPGEVTLALRPDALEDPDDYGALGLASLRGADAPVFMHQHGEPSLVLAFSPDSELAAPAQVVMLAPDAAPDGTTFDLSVLGGLYTPLASGEVVDEGALAQFGTATVHDGRLTIEGLPRLGWIALTRR